MEHIQDLVRGRKSVRTYDGSSITQEDQEKLLAFLPKIKNPYGIPLEYKLLDAKAHGLSCPVVSGTDLYVGAKLKFGPLANVAFGYSFELLVLYAQSLGLGTVWIGGTMNRGAYEKAMELGNDEIMPCVSPLGYPAKAPSLRDTMMRRAIKADSRMPFQLLFFDGAFGVPLTEEKAGSLAEPLEMVRWAPSAVNKQPWRVVVDGNAAHFYLKRAKGVSGGAVVDMQKIDLGIALCHFELAAREKGLDVTFSTSDPGLPTETGTEYIASYLLLR